MGEYAQRKSDGVEVKIGTCEEMYYLRFEDRDKVRKIPNSLDPVREAGQLRFRLPFPDEDHILPGGEYKDPERSQRLYRSNGFGSQSYNEDFTDESMAEHPGSFQMHHQESGLLFSVPCYHGVKLPDLGPNVRPGWNGKGHSFELRSLRPVEVDGELKVYPVVRCRHCREQWRYEWSDIWAYVPMPLRSALRVYAEPKTATQEVTA